MSASPETLERLREAIGIEAKILAANPSPAGIVPLRLHCANTSCKKGRHFFNHVQGPQKLRNRWSAPAGMCCACRASILDPAAFESGSSADAGALVSILCSQQHELIRAHYWNVPIDAYAYNQALRAGRLALHRKAESKIRKDLMTFNDFSGRQAAYSGNIISYAQHATATCCYQCAAIWHGLPMPGEGTPSGAQLQRVVDAALLYLDIRLPDLPDEGQKVPGIRQEDAMLPARVVAALDEDLVAKLDSDHDPAGLTYANASALRILPFRYAGTSQVKFVYAPLIGTEEADSA